MNPPLVIESIDPVTIELLVDAAKRNNQRFDAFISQLLSERADTEFAQQQCDDARTSL